MTNPASDMKTCRPPKRHPQLLPTPVWHREALTRIWLAPDDIAQLVNMRSQVLEAMENKFPTELLQLASKSREQITECFKRVSRQMPTHGLGFLVEPFLVTYDELWLLKALVHDAEVVLAYELLPGTEPDRYMVYQYQQLTLIRARLYKNELC